MTLLLMTENETTHEHCNISVTKYNEVVVRSEDGSVCSETRRQAARLAEDGYRVTLKVAGFGR